MNVGNRRPAWWQLWLLIPVLGILAFVDTRASLSPAGHTVVDVAIVLILFGLVAIWLRANRLALLRETHEQGVWDEVAKTATLPLEPATFAHGNGNGHKRGWSILRELPESDDAAWDDREMRR